LYVLLIVEMERRAIHVLGCPSVFGPPNNKNCSLGLQPSYITNILILSREILSLGSIARLFLDDLGSIPILTM
jgi:hypothetical protein